jgi:hypothetical protein
MNNRRDTHSSLSPIWQENAALIKQGGEAKPTSRLGLSEGLEEWHELHRTALCLHNHNFESNRVSSMISE